jgi:hypothetical protein
MSKQLSDAGTVNITLLDGSTFKMQDYYNVITGASGWQFWANEVGTNIYYKKTDKSLTTYGPNDRYMVFDYQEYEDLWQNASSEHNYMLTNTEKFVNAVYNNSSHPPDDINPEDVLSAASLDSYSTDENTTAPYGLSRAAISFLGIDSDLNSSFTIKYDPADGHTFPGNPIKPVDVGGATVSNVSIGDEAIIDGSEIVSADIESDADHEVIGTRLMVTTENGTSFEIIGNDYDQDGTWLYNMKDDKITSLIDTANETKSVDMSVSVKVIYNETIAEATDSFLVTYDPEGIVARELYGALYTDWKPSATSGDYITGYVYNTTNADSPVWWIGNRPDETRRFQLDGEFEIVKMQNPQTGEEYNSTTLYNKRDQVELNTTYWNESDLQMWEDYHADWSEVFEESSGGGSISFGDWTLGDILPDLGEDTWGIILVVGAILLLIGLVRR